MGGGEGPITVGVGGAWLVAVTVAGEERPLRERWNRTASEDTADQGPGWSWGCVEEMDMLTPSLCLLDPPSQWYFPHCHLAGPRDTGPQGEVGVAVGTGL